jgi:hypothetical protein
MTKNQNVLINVEQEDRQEATFMSSSFVNPSVKNRAYLNTLGAELITRYLRENGIGVLESGNVHSLSKVLEKTDISDILLDNIHIDVRVIFDEAQIFIPKSHYDLDILPDVYAVVKFAVDYSSANFLGYILPSQIDKNNQNNEYYFVDGSSLSSPDGFGAFVKSFEGKLQRDLSEEDFSKGRELSVSLADHNITDTDYRAFLELVFANSSLREEVLEFDNFETLSYNTIPLIADKVEENVSAPVFISENLVEETEIPQEKEAVEETQTVENNITEEVSVEENPENDDFSFDLDFEGVDLSQEEIALDVAEVEPKAEIETKENENNKNEIIEQQSVKDKRLLSVDDILDATIASIDTGVAVDFATGVGAAEALVGGTEVLGSVVEDAVDAIIPKEKDELSSVDEKSQIKEEDNNKISYEVDNAVNEAVVSDGAIKLAGLSGEVVEHIVDDNANKQQENLDKIDYEKTNIYSESSDISDDIENISRLSALKQENNSKNETSGLYETPKDLDELNPVEQKTEEDFVPEISSFEEMDTVEQETYPQVSADDFEMAELSDVDLSADIGDLPLNTESEDVELMDMDISGGYTINDDGSSNFDDLGLELNTNSDVEENFIDFDMGTSSAKKEEDEEVSIEEPLDEISTDAIDNSIVEESSMGLVEDKEPQIFELEGDEVLPEESLVNEDLTLSLEDEKEDDDEDEVVEVDDFFSNDEETQEDDGANFEELSPDIDLSEEQGEDEILSEENLVDEDLTLSLEDEKDENEVFEGQNSENIDIEGDIQNINIDNKNVEDISYDSQNEEGQSIDDLDLLDSENVESENKFEEETGMAQDEVSVIDDVLEEDVIAKSEEEEKNEEETQTEENVISSEEWLESSDFSELEDDTITNNEENIVISEENEVPKVYNVVENSKVITDKNFEVGEIPFDINLEQLPIAENENLEELYSQAEEVPSLLQNSGRVPSSAVINKKLPLGLALLGVLISLVLVGAIGFGVSKMLKPSNDDEPQPITDEPISASDNSVNTVDTLNVNPDNVVNMNDTTSPQVNEVKPAVAQSVKPTVQSSTSVAKSTPTSFIQVKKLTWEVPDYVSYDSQFKQYFQSAGKSLKLALSSDLLLATDLVYSNSARVSIVFDKDGNYKTAVVVNSSGSAQIDKIVLQTVKQTLTSLKAPRSVGNDENTTAILKIYF